MHELDLQISEQQYLRALSIINSKSEERFTTINAFLCQMGLPYQENSHRIIIKGRTNLSEEARVYMDLLETCFDDGGSITITSNAGGITSRYEIIGARFTSVEIPVVIIELKDFLKQCHNSEILFTQPLYIALIKYATYHGLAYLPMQHVTAKLLISLGIAAAPPAEAPMVIELLLNNHKKVPKDDDTLE